MTLVIMTTYYYRSLSTRRPRIVGLFNSQGRLELRGSGPMVIFSPSYHYFGLGCILGNARSRSIRLVFILVSHSLVSFHCTSILHIILISYPFRCMFSSLRILEHCYQFCIHMFCYSSIIHIFHGLTLGTLKTLFWGLLL